VTATLRALPPLPVDGEDAAGVVVVGTGAAGASAALEAAAQGADVLVISKGDGSTPWAQGGLAAVLGPDDAPELHARDTETAGAGLCDPGAVGSLVAAAPVEIRRLAALGARFDVGHLGLEGGHSRRRIVHAGGDASGAEVHRVLGTHLLRAVGAGRLRLWDDAVALDALVEAGRVCGLLVARRLGGRPHVVRIAANAVVLATGGFGHAYATTTNPAGVTGDGLALAARAGAEVADVEFVQFHPTVLWQPGRRGRRPLLTEALRGAGALIVDDTGQRVMTGVHPLADLAPRDVVSSAMAEAMAERGSDHLYLDARRVSGLEAEFPTVVAACRAAGVDPATEPVPIAPGAHYACGGVRADMDGVTSLEGLFAVGEVAATGVHGANRLASNSLTESLTLGRRVGRRLAGLRRPTRPAAGSVPAGPGVDPAGRADTADAMSRHCGVRRCATGLESLLEDLDGAGVAEGPVGLEVVEATNLHTVSVLVATAALLRTESRGCHRRSDFPSSDEGWARRSVLRVSDGRVGAALGAGA
jgi:L-aspartate oxidase